LLCQRAELQKFGQDNSQLEAAPPVDVIDSIAHDVEQTRLDDLLNAHTDRYYSEIREADKSWTQELRFKVSVRSSGLIVKPRLGVN
jgi:hypothetical protein